MDLLKKKDHRRFPKNGARSNDIEYTIELYALAAFSHRATVRRHSAPAQCPSTEQVEHIGRPELKSWWQRKYHKDDYRVAKDRGNRNHEGEWHGKIQGGPGGRRARHTLPRYVVMLTNHSRAEAAMFDSLTDSEGEGEQKRSTSSAVQRAGVSVLLLHATPPTPQTMRFISSPLFRMTGHCTILHGQKWATQSPRCRQKRLLVPHRIRARNPAGAWS